MAWSARKARLAQAQLDYMAPEVQLETTTHATTACDMFALGSLICAVYNAGNTPIAAAHNLATYAVHAKQVLSDIRPPSLRGPIAPCIPFSVSLSVSYLPLRP